MGPRGRVTSAVVCGAWMAIVLMISSVCRRTLRTNSIFEEPASALLLGAAIGKLRKLLGRCMWWTRRWVLGTGRREWLGVLRTASLPGIVIVLSVREMSTYPFEK